MTHSVKRVRLVYACKGALAQTTQTAAINESKSIVAKRRL